MVQRREQGTQEEKICENIINTLTIPYHLTHWSVICRQSSETMADVRMCSELQTTSASPTEADVELIGKTKYLITHDLNQTERISPATSNTGVQRLRSEAMLTEAEFLYDQRR